MKKILMFIMTMIFSLSVLANPSTIRPAIQENMEAIKVLLSSKQFTEESDELYVLLDTELEDIVDYYTFGRKILGKHARRMSDDEIRDFADITKQKLFRLYIGIALDQPEFQYEIKQVMVHTRNDKLARVNINISDKPYHVIYYMLKGKDDTWKIYNVAAEGINFGMLLRDQFNDLVSATRNLKLAIVEWQKI